jgi:hypothetical protein
MAKASAAVATAQPRQINGTDVAVHTARTIGAGLHTGFTFLADASKFTTARIVHAMDKTISVQDTDDYIQAITDTRLAKARITMSGYKTAPVK